MKSYKDFTSSRIVESDLEVVVEQPQELEILELEELPNLLGEESKDKNPMDPPAVLIMHRKSIRQYPNNQRVALYYVDKINKYVTVPYTAMQWSVSVKENSEYTDIIEQLEKIVTQNYKDIVVHIDGSESNVCVEQAQIVLNVYENLNDVNKEKFKEKLSESDYQFKQSYNFVKNI